MISFQDKTLLITGGTGSFGNAVLDRFLTTDIREIRILSRDEKKQDDMRHAYQELYPQHAQKIKFYIGDVRDYDSIVHAFRGVDYVFHAAALKQVPWTTSSPPVLPTVCRRQSSCRRIRRRIRSMPWA